MPKGDPAGYLPNVKKSRKSAGSMLKPAKRPYKGLQVTKAAVLRRLKKGQK